jgi:lysophospholipase
VLEAVRTPVLILATSADRLVSWRAIRKVAARLPNARLVTYGREARHEILREADGVRNAALRELDAFLDSVAPLP